MSVGVGVFLSTERSKEVGYPTHRLSCSGTLHLSTVQLVDQRES